MSSRAVVRPRVGRARVSTRAAVLCIVVLTVLTFAIAPMRALLVERDKLGQLQQQAEQLDRQNDALRQRIAHLQDPAYLERLARECLGMVAPGETAFVTVPEHGPAADSDDC